MFLKNKMTTKIVKGPFDSYVFFYLVQNRYRPQSTDLLRVLLPKYLKNNKKKKSNPNQKNKNPRKHHEHHYQTLF